MAVGLVIMSERELNRIEVLSQATRYQPTGKRNDGWNSKLAKRAKKQAEAAPPHAAE